MAKQGTYATRWYVGQLGVRGGFRRGVRTGRKNQRARESAQARSPKWNSMTELEREKGNSDEKGAGNEMQR